MKEIPLRNSVLVAIIDDDDFELVSQYKWDLHAKGYAYCRFWNGGGYTTVYMHRLVMNAPKGIEVDHRHHDKLDNRKGELRLGTHAQNHGNIKIERVGKKTSRFKGVSRRPNVATWQAHTATTVDGKRVSMYLGSFSDEVEAAQAYNEAASRVFGQFARLNDLCTK